MTVVESVGKVNIRLVDQGSKVAVMLEHANDLMVVVVNGERQQLNINSTEAFQKVKCED